MTLRTLARLAIATMLLHGTAPAARAQAPSAAPAWPSTPAAALVKAWISAVSAGTDSAYRAFASRYVEDPSNPSMIETSVANLRNVRERTGGLDVQRIAASSDRSMVIEAITRGSQRRYRLTYDIGRRPDGSVFIDGVQPAPMSP
ncbi:MAG: hypothetical protein HY275_16080 [Gemmatimonadetes bacterium]|nr:hypothetical protein [Gemmatimonadota bacterium]